MPEQTENATPQPPKQKSPLLLIILVLVLISGGATAWFFMHQKSAAAAPPVSADLKPKAMLHLESFVVNLADQDEKAFLRAGIDLGIGKEISKKEAGAATEFLPIVRDSVIGVLSTCKSADLLTAEGKKRVKEDLLNNLNQRLPELQVREIYFTEFLVQR